MKNYSRNPRVLSISLQYVVRIHNYTHTNTKYHKSDMTLLQDGAVARHTMRYDFTVVR